jgi:hypothetical protein
MEGGKKPHGQLQGDYEQLQLSCQLYTYITSGLGFRKFKVLDFCCTVYISNIFFLIIIIITIVSSKTL